MDEIIFFGETTLNNVRITKSFMRCFELTSRLKTILVFHLLGIPIVANSRTEETWKFVISKFPKLSMWKHKTLSLAVCCEEIKIERIGCPRSHGGLGINGLSMFNDAFLAKWMWNLFRQIDSLWSKFLTIYGS
ncbi:hypothetical protein GmHk_09G025156 [Glycine max]|nr:hypothetical protein GmHk_09G025156 [Glycine max]